MKTVLKLLKKWWFLIGAVLAVTPGFWSAYILSFQADTDQTVSMRGAFADSFNNQIDSAQSRGDTEEANRVRIDLEQFEETWRETPSILDKLSSAIFMTPEQVDVLTKQSITMWAYDVEAHPEWAIDYDSIDLGNAWFVAGMYDKAANEYFTAQLAGLDYPDLALSRLRALYYAGIFADTEEQRNAFEAQAVSTLLDVYPTAYREEPPPIFRTDPDFLAYYNSLSGQDLPDD